MGARPADLACRRAPPHRGRRVSFPDITGDLKARLPDLRGRIPIHQSGANPLATKAGDENITLLTAQLPAHTHDLRAGAGGTKTSSPANAFFASGGPQQYASNRVAPLTGALQGGLAPTGGNQPHNNMMPYLTVSFIISLFGIFPTQ